MVQYVYIIKIRISMIYINQYISYGLDFDGMDELGDTDGLLGGLIELLDPFELDG